MGGGRATLEHAEILRTLAEVATAFAGFTGIVVAISGRGRLAWRSDQTIAVAILLASSLGVVFFAFAPDLARAAHLESEHAWRVSTASFAAYRLVVMVAGLRAGRRAAAGGESDFGNQRLGLLSFIGGVSIVVAQFVTAAGLLSSWLFFFYLLGLLFVFVLLLMHTMSTPAERSG